MKKIIYGMFAFAALALTACGGEKSTDGATNIEEEVVAEYSLETEKSNLEWSGSWTGGESDGKTHHGVINISNGRIFQDGDKYHGDLSVDMTSIDVKDLDEASGKPRLEGRLATELFFNIEEYAVTNVKVKEIVDGNASITIVVAGVEIGKTVPVSINNKDEVMTIDGKFTIDISEVGMPGMELNPEAPEQGTVSSEINFKLHAVLNKK